MAYSVYVLLSEKNGKRYTGYTSQSVSKRLDWHKWGLNQWTRQNGPFSLLHVEKFESKEQALKREAFFKTGQGRRALDSILQRK